jgi:hypothetical protein
MELAGNVINHVKTDPERDMENNALSMHCSELLLPTT